MMRYKNLPVTTECRQFYYYFFFALGIIRNIVESDVSFICLIDLNLKYHQVYILNGINNQKPQKCKAKLQTF